MSVYVCVYVTGRVSLLPGFSPMVGVWNQLTAIIEGSQKYDT